MGWLSLKRITGSEGLNLGGAAQSVVNAVSDAGKAIDDAVNEVVPGGWATVVSVVNPALAPVAAGTQALVNGASLTDALKAAALTYGVQTAAGKIVGTSASNVTPEMVATANATTDPIASLAAQAGWVNVDPSYIAQISAPQASLDILTDTVAPPDFTPDYSLTSETASNTGLQASPITSDPLAAGAADYSLTVKSQIEGLKPFTIPSLESMGGGQGLVAPVEGGFVTSKGFIPLDAVMDIGNPASFINGGSVNVSALQERLNEVVQKKILQEALGGLIGVGAASLASQPSTAPSVPAYQGENTLPMYDDAYFQAVQQNYNALAPQGLMADVATPLKDWYVSDESRIQRLFGGA